VAGISEEDAPLYRAACRNIILHAIGLMAGRNLEETRAVEREGGEWASWQDVPEDAIRGTETESGEDILYQSQARAPRGAFDHPELAHQVWGWTRATLLSRRFKDGEEWARVGALHLPREQVVGFAQDAIYATTDPGWPTSKNGIGFRVKGKAQGPFPAPRNRRELLALVGEG
jgi:hypothetical protein